MGKKYSEITDHWHEIVITDSNVAIDFSNKRENIGLQDDFYMYISDSFQWIESEFPTGELFKGLAYEGISVLDLENTKKFKEIIKLWEGLFSLSAEPIILRDNFIVLDEDDCDTYFFKFDKESILNDLNRIVELCDEVILKDSGITIYGL